MQPIQVDPLRDSRLRFVFNDAVLSVDLAANATFADIAQALGSATSRHGGVPVGIDVTFAVTPASLAGPPAAAARGRRAN